MDELLGIPAGGGATKPPEEEEALRKARERLQRTLDEEEVESLLQQVLGDMRSSAERLGERSDPGVDTQRMQRGVIDKLDILIQQAQRRRQQAGSSSSSSSRGQQDSQAQGENQGKPSESESRDGASRNQAGESREMDPPAPEDPTDQDRLLDETRAEWGNLPARVRELIRQGSRDRVASLYQRLTQEYYRRMAEDASR